jgi:uncharacterized Fe-S cluster protein YjdI
MREYSTDEITVFWEPSKCIHARECVKGLPQVFDGSKKPWVNINGASAEEIMDVIDRCPSGALSYKRMQPGSGQTEPVHSGPVTRIKVLDKGPLLVEGNCVLVNKGGKEEFKSGPFALCRCGRSRNKPYCDGSHKDVEFDEGI